MSKLLDGKAVAAEIVNDVQQELIHYQSQGIRFKLCVILVGDHPASNSYVRGKEKMAGKIGMDSEIIRLPDTISEEMLLAEVSRLNDDDTVDGILVQLPLPSHIAEQAILEAVRPEKDVDGFHPVNSGRNFSGLPAVWPCTPAGVIEMLHRRGIGISGKHAVVVGRSNIVGKPMAMLLLQENATVTVCHSKTADLKSITKQADLLVVAIGRPKAVTQEHVKPGAVVIDVGINRLDGQLVGDVDFGPVSEIADYITPVPGGVGPLTIAMLMANVITLGKRRRGLGSVTV